MKSILILVAATLAPALAHADESLSLLTVDRVVEQHDRAIQACGHGRRGDTLAVVVRMTIDEYGRVTEAAAPTASPEGQCLAKLARKLSFPRSSMQTRLAYPFLLMPHVVHH